MLISSEDRSDKACFTQKMALWHSGMTLPLYKRDRGVPEKTGDATNSDKVADAKGPDSYYRADGCGVRNETMGYILPLKVVFYGSFLVSGALACLLASKIWQKIDKHFNDFEYR